MVCSSINGDNRSHLVWLLYRWNKIKHIKDFAQCLTPKRSGSVSLLPQSLEGREHNPPPFSSLLLHSIHRMPNAQEAHNQYSLNWIIQRPVLRHCPREKLHRGAVSSHTFLVSQKCPLKCRDIFHREELELSWHTGMCGNHARFQEHGESPGGDLKTESLVPVTPCVKKTTSNFIWENKNPSHGLHSLVRKGVVERENIHL